MATARKIAIGATSAAVIAAAVPFLQHWEGTKLVASHNSFDPPGVIDVCHGNTQADIPNLKAGDRYTVPECGELLKVKIPTYDACLTQNLKPEVYNALPLQRHVALISFVYNLGCGWFTAARRDANGNVVTPSIAQSLNAGNVAAACARFKDFVYANHVRLRGLENRRFADPQWNEYDRCMSER